VADRVTIERLASAKNIPADFLRRLGLLDRPEGVLFDYRTSSGAPARPRLRTAMRGADGSSWEYPSALPITIYAPPVWFTPTVDPHSLVIVEGESDCWSAWLHGVAACGIPGPEHGDKIEASHIAGIDTIYLLREPAPADSRTYRAGVEAYISTIVGRLRQIGYRGGLFELRMPDGLFDLSELHHRDPTQFLVRLAAAKAAARHLD
jgi:hypothetical protein